MKKIDTSKWKEFRIGDLFYKLDLRIKKGDFDKRQDTSAEKTDEFSLPLVNAKEGNNGIMYYGRPTDFESAELCLDIVQNGAIATGNVYAQIKSVGVLWDAYLIKPFASLNGYSLLFLSGILQKVLKSLYSYDDKAVWDKVKNDYILLPVNDKGQPDWAYMEQYMKIIEKQVRMSIDKLTNVIGGGKKSLNTSKWGTFMVGELFEIYKPQVYHTYEVKENPNGIPYVVRSKFDNGIKYRVYKNSNIVTSPDGVISFGSENATFFYQGEEWCSGRDIYYIDTRGIPKESCLFIIACLQTIVGKYSYSNGLFPDLLRRETIKLPIDGYGKPDWNYMKSSILSIKERISSSPILL